jgi:phosphoribosylformylglycinamidine cyclo-ligase
LKEIKGMCHITGGGFYGNIPRVLPEGLACHIDLCSLEIPELFKFIREKGNIPDREMFSVFNMGIGMLVICEKDLGLGNLIGEIKKGDVPVVIDGL